MMRLRLATKHNNRGCNIGVSICVAAAAVDENENRDDEGGALMWARMLERTVGIKAGVPSRSRWSMVK